MSAQDSGFEVIDLNRLRYAAEKGEGAFMATQERLNVPGEHQFLVRMTAEEVPGGGLF